jgi:hypothetical protein
MYVHQHCLSVKAVLGDVSSVRAARRQTLAFDCAVATCRGAPSTVLPVKANRYRVWRCNPETIRYLRCVCRCADQGNIGLVTSHAHEHLQFVVHPSAVFLLERMGSGPSTSTEELQQAFSKLT